MQEFHRELFKQKQYMSVCAHVINHVWICTSCMPSIYLRYITIIQVGCNGIEARTNHRISLIYVCIFCPCACMCHAWAIQLYVLETYICSRVQ